MSWGQRLGAMGVFFCVATVLAEAGLILVLQQRGVLNAQTAHHLLTVAYDVPVRDIYEEMARKAQPVKKEMVSFTEVQEARMLSMLDLDLREMATDKGLLDVRELAVLLDQEKGRYSVVKDRFDQDWRNLQQGATDTALRSLQHKIESLQPKAAKDQLLRILDSPDLPPETALNQVVTIFKNMAIDKRKKIVEEFKDRDTQRLQDILRQIRLGMPEVNVLRDTRVRLQEFRLQE
jgi:hypothetical protein